ncbi:hypothetical protein [Dermacoccus sp. Tok2021]|uniref:hypothetical protein n=1 Tax=Dermacoccus sp. Tok2021 TaxID=2826873 RepID=UPI001CA63162|nr:hypothetical protein [Dermacoccus sp. Tok2021]MBZ4497115.1 hypothetical protein [Dermacoccus sp. Tok2021]
MSDNDWTKREQGTPGQEDDATRQWGASPAQGSNNAEAPHDSSEERTRAFTAPNESGAQNTGATGQNDSSEDRTRAFTAPNESGTQNAGDQAQYGSAPAAGGQNGQQQGGQYGQSPYGANAQGQQYGQNNSSIGQGFSNGQNQYGSPQYGSASQGDAGYGSSSPQSNQNRYDSAPPSSGQYGQNSYGSTPQGGQYGQPNQTENAQYGQNSQGANSSIGQGFSTHQNQYDSAPQGGGQYGQNQYGFPGQSGQGHQYGQPGHNGQYGQNNAWQGGDANNANSPFGAGGQGAAAALQVKNPDGSLRIGRVGLLASLAAQFFVIIGCLGPWASVWGSSVSGMNGDGVIVLLLSLAIIGLGVAHLLGKVPAKFLWGIVVAAAISFIVGLIDYGNVSDVASVGWGLVFVIFFSLVSGGAAALAALRD